MSKLTMQGIPVSTDSNGIAVLNCQSASETIIAQKDKDIAFVRSIFPLTNTSTNTFVWHVFNGNVTNYKLM